MSAAIAPGPQRLGAEAMALKSGGWYLPRGGSQWAPVTEHAPGPAIGQCWWSATKPPGNGWWQPPEER